jgi:glycyl-tRNA synthetase alpha chain
MTFQEILSTLEQFWAKKGCLIVYPYDIEMGAGTMHPMTFFRSLGPDPWNVAYVQPCRRPADSRYGENPNRGQHYYQYQVIMKPSPDDIIGMYFDSLRALGIDPLDHDLRLVEDDWESPSLGASGVGWQVWMDGEEITQFTYFQQVGGIECRPVPVEITYGPERIAAHLQGAPSMWELEWARGTRYKDLDLAAEVENSRYNLECANVEMLSRLFDMFEGEGHAMLDKGLVAPAYDYTLKCSHVFNLLDARGSISVSQRAQHILRMRRLAFGCARLYVDRVTAAEPEAVAAS